MNLTPTFEKLRDQLQRSLADPGRLAWRHRCRSMFSPSLAYGRHFGPPLPSARQAAVMILLEPCNDSWSIPVTVRSNHLPDHPGQISLPGGRLEAGESFQQAAEREFGEELGCVPFPGQVVGALLPLYVFHSNYYVQPMVAITDRSLVYVPCAREVTEVLHLPLTSVTNSLAQPPQDFERGLVTWTAPTITCGHARIWGATAIVLGELLALLADPPQNLLTPPPSRLVPPRISGQRVSGH